MIRGCNFAAVILKGLIEHNDSRAYFGSILGWVNYMNEAYENGWVTTGAGKVTEAGKEHYTSSGLARVGPWDHRDWKEGMKPNKYSRAYMWDWSPYNPEEKNG